MEGEQKVFTSEIIRAQKPIQNDLHELVKVIPATPVTSISKKEEITLVCDFQPETGKHYTPKKRSRSKVKTVRDIRLSYEQDELSYWPEEIEKQQQYLLRKIKSGHSKDVHTKTIAKKIMSCDQPISRSALQMLMTINPFDQICCKQYVLFNGKQVYISGSTGGKKSNLYKFDLSKKRLPPRNRPKIRIAKGKKGLLRYSLAVKFKPGPLVKKANLDDSYQKYNVGSTELVKIPKVAFSIKPSPGIALEPSISRFVQNLCNADGTISETWAEYSVSAVIKTNNENITQYDKEAISTVTFDLNFKCDQKKILMRRDIDSICNETENLKGEKTIPKDEDTFDDIKRMLSRILDAVEINLLQDTICLEDDTPREHCDHNPGRTDINLTTQAKDKKKKRFTELDKLDVTVIQLPADDYKEENELCSNSFCSLGCICQSLKNPFKIKQHCGRIECMFQCKCDFSRYGLNHIENAELLSGIINLNTETNSKLAKEEQKFHQTVVVTGDQSIVLKTQKRQFKPSKRYANFYSEVSLKTDVKLRQKVSVVITKLSCENIEPWCMVHKLYKCFCKGKITHTISIANNTDDHIMAINYPEEETVAANSDDSINRRKSSLNTTKRSKTISIDDSSDQSEFDIELSARCARCAMPYERKHKASYYWQMNKKITKMEKDDKYLRKRLLQLMNVQSLSDENDAVSNVNQDQRNETPPLLLDDERSYGKRRTVRPSRYNEEKSMHVEKKSRDSHYKTQTIKETSVPVRVSRKRSEKVDVIEEKCLGQAMENLAPNDSPKAGTAKLNYHEVTTDDAIQTNIQPPTANEVLPKDKSRLMDWLVSSYQMYKRRESQGRIVVDRPKNKKLVIYPVSFIQSRYTERKNIFLVTKNKPYRLFMAVDIRDTFLEQCINISCIRMADLHKYPVTVQNLIKGDSDCHDNFFILCGLRCCWEFVGSISKISDQTPTYSALSESTENLSQPKEALNDMSINEKSESFGESGEHGMVLDSQCDKEDDSKQCSKWFVLTVESDFSEIQFCERGFFVKYESIIKAINVARLSKKTVRLSSQKNGEDHSDPQFGIYAVPRTDEHCVFIGPYLNEQSLGIEIIDSKQSNPKKSKGFWVSTEKKENYKVIDNPLSFLPPSTTHSKSCVEYKTLKNQLLEPIPTISNSDVKKPNITTMDPEGVKDTKSSTPTMLQALLNDKPKPIKPIKINKADGVYYLLPKGCFTKLKPSETPGKSKSILNQHAESTVAGNPRIVLPTSSKSILKHSKVSLQPIIENVKPIAEIAPQIKIVDVYSESSMQPENSTANSRRGMFILKPEEINKRSMKNVSSRAPESDTPHSNEPGDRTLDLDIENFLATSTVYVPSNADILMRSEEAITARKPIIKEVFIICKTVENLGWIPGIRNPDNHLSFKFPGFVYTEFYPEAEAFSKINQVLSRKVYVPANIKLEWAVCESVEQMQCKEILSSEQLGLDFVLTRRGLRHKRDIITYVTAHKSASSVQCWSSSSSTLTAELSEVEKASDLWNDLEDESEEVNDRNKQLMQEFAAATTTSPALLRSISGDITNTQREQMAEALKDLLSRAAEDC